MTRTISIPVAENHPAMLKSLMPSARILHWKEMLELMKNEVSFYRKLLAVGIFNCRAAAKQETELLLPEFIRLEDRTMQELEEALLQLNKTAPEEGISPVIFQERLQTASARLNSLKKQVFPLLSSLQPVTIW